jgi:hypothetical protein
MEEIMLSRQKSVSVFVSYSRMHANQPKGLIVVGDITLAAFEQAQKDQQKKGSKGKGNGKDEPNFGGKLLYIGKDNQRQLVQAEALRKTYWRFQSKGRVVAMTVSQGEEMEGGEIEG